MDFSIIKNGFAAYLETKNDKSQNTQKKYDTEAADFNIFRYSTEFKEYMSKEYSSDESIKSMSVNDILNMEIEGGKLVDPKKVEEYDEAINNELTGTEEAPVEGEEPAEEVPVDGEETVPVEGEETRFTNSLISLFMLLTPVLLRKAS